MGHVISLARRRPTARFFRTDCQIANMAHKAIERMRIDYENALLRKEIAELKKLLSASVRELHTTAVCLSDLQQREPALLNHIARSEESLRYTQEALAIANERIAFLSQAVTGLRNRMAVV